MDKTPLIKPMYADELESTDPVDNPAGVEPIFDSKLEVIKKTFPDAYYTHLFGVCDMLCGYVDQKRVNIPKLAYNLVHNIDVQDSVISLMFNISQAAAAEMRLTLIRDRKLDETDSVRLFCDL